MAQGAAAPGDRAVAVGGDVVDSVIVTGDNVRIEVAAGGLGGTLLHLLGWRRKVRKRARPTPLAVRPGPFDGVDRDREARELAGGAVSPLNATGEGLVGKTYVVRAGLERPEAASLREGIVYLSGRGRALEDLLQALWEEFYESRPPTKPSARELREDLAKRAALVVVDDVELEHRDAQALATALPSCRVVLVSRERQLWDGDELRIAGLPAEDALALFDRYLGRRVADAERDVAARIVAALDGHPQRLRQAAGLLARTGGTLDELARIAARGPGAIANALVGATTDREQEVLAALEPFGQARLAAAELDRLAGAGAAEVAARLTGLGLSSSHSPSYSAAAEISTALPPKLVEAARRQSVTVMTELAETSPAAFAASTEPPLALLRRLVEWQRWEDVVRFGRALAPALVLARRFAAWGEAASLVEDAAARLGDAGAEAWALHERGTLALSREDEAGRVLLRRALDRRERLGDADGAAATRHNLGLPLKPPWYLRRIVHLPVIGLLIAIAVLGSAAGIALGTWMNDGGGTTSTTRAGDVRLELVVDGSGTVSGSAADISCSERCSYGVQAGEQLTLTADPADGWRFEHWSAPCRQGLTCKLAPDDDVTVTARFSKLAAGRRALNITIVGTGTVTAGSSLPCVDDCQRVFDDGATVELRAEASDDWRFSAWSGACTGDACSVTLDGDSEVTATFVEITTPEGGHRLDVEQPTGGLITSMPRGISCPVDCSHEFEADDVTLHAAANGGWRLADWGYGDCQPSATDCDVQLDADVTVSPVFERLVTLSIRPPAGGSISFDADDGASLTCPSACDARYPVGTEVKLEATADSGFGPIRWNHEGCVDGGTCSVEMTVDTNLAPVFPRETTLELILSGKGSGTVTLDDPKLTCTTSPCRATVFVGDEVRVTAGAGSRSDFVGWRGDASTCGTHVDCTIEIDDSASVEAFFQPQPTVTLTVDGPPSLVVSRPRGLSCATTTKQTTCTDTAVFPRGTSVSLTPRPGEQVHLESWGGACSGTATCSFTVTGSTTISATFLSDLE